MENNGSIIGKARGNVFGHPISPHRAALAGIISWHNWLKNIVLFADITITNNIIIYTPSKTISKELSPKFNCKVMKNTLMDDCDLVNAIHQMASDLKMQ